MAARDKNNIEFKVGDICKATDSTGKVWEAPIKLHWLDWYPPRKPGFELTFMSNYKVFLGDKKHDKFEIETTCN